MADWTDTLSSLHLAGLSEVFPSSASAARQAAVTLDREGKHARRAARRTFLNHTAVANAAAQLERLPNVGESFHGIISHSTHGFAFLPAILTLAGCPAVEANIATLGFNEGNTLELFDLLDRGHVERCTFIYSTYFKGKEPEIVDRLVAGLRGRGHRVLCCRSHAKIILVNTADGRHFAWESSANMRSCRNVEQYVLTHDRELVEFHRAWMHELFAKGDQR